MIIFILWIQKVRQRGHLICPRTAGKQQGQGWNQAGWLQNLPSSLPPFERISSNSYWTADLCHLFPWSDQPLQRIRILHIQHSTSVAIPTCLLEHLYQPLWIKPISQKKKKKKTNQWKQCWKEKSSKKEQAEWWVPHWLWLTVSFWWISFCGTWTTQLEGPYSQPTTSASFVPSDTAISGSQIFKKKNPESSKRQNLNLLHINNYSHSIDFVFRTIYTELMWY